MGEAKHDGLVVPGRVVLAHEPPFKLGKLHVIPALLQLEFQHARLTLERRVMQVLVMLAKAKGAIVTRDDLLVTCWDGRIVSDNAINRVISRLRQIGSSFCRGCFEIETITKVGFRLAIERDAASSQSNNELATDQPLGRRAVVAGLVAAGVAAGAGAAWLKLGNQSGPQPDARSYYGQAIALRGQRSLAQNEQSIGYLREAVRLDPNYADAWGALAWAYRGSLEYGARPDMEHIKLLSRSAAARALDLDPDNGDAQATILLLEPYYRRWSEVEQGCRKLIGRHPANEIPQFNLGWILNEVGRWRESLPLFRELANREPFWPLARYNYVRALYCSDRLEEPDQLLDDALQRWPRRPDFWQLKSRYLAVTGRTREAADFVSDLAKRPAETGPEIAIETIVVPVVGGSAADRAAAAERLVDLVSSQPMPTSIFTVNAITGTALLGQLDLTFGILEGYYFGRGEWAFMRPERRASLFLFFPYLAPLRADLRFGRMIDEIGLEEYWRASGTQPDYRRFAPA